MKPITTDPRFDLYHGGALEVLRSLPDGCAHTCVTSPPYYGLRRYEGCDPATMIGLEETPDCLAWARGADPCGACFVCKLRAVFREVFRVLRPGSCAWVNLGDSYAGSGCGAGDKRPEGSSLSKSDAKYQGQRPGIARGLKPKDMIGVPFRVALALQADGWYLRTDIVWVKGASFGPFHGAPMPESVTDRPTRAHEFLFLLANARDYYYDAEAVKERASETSTDARRKSRGPVNEKATAGEVRGAGAFEGYRPAFRNLRDCWTLSPEASGEDHYAAYPRRLVEPCIRAGTSERGVCAKCGAPWDRQVEREPGFQARKNAIGVRTGAALDADYRGIGIGRSTTLGWSPSCACVDAGEVLPGVVLDPFCGTGTTGVSALTLGRKFIGVDLSEVYLRDIAAPRLAATVKGITVAEERNGQAVLF